MAKIEDDDSMPGKDNPSRDRSSSGRGRNRSRKKSPDEKWEIVVKDHNLVLRDLAANEESPLTCDGTENDGYESRIYWSPDSKKMVAM